jgi:hypothetical protein
VIRIPGVALALPGGWPYLKHGSLGRRWENTAPLVVSDRWSEMAQHLSTPRSLHGEIRPPRRLARAVVVGGVGLGVLLLLVALVLWAHYGTAVFFEMIASGISACF